MPSLLSFQSLTLLAGLSATLAAAEPIKLGFTKSPSYSPAEFVKRADGTVEAVLAQDQYKSMYT